MTVRKKSAASSLKVLTGAGWGDHGRRMAHKTHKTHKFTISVRTLRTKREAHMAVLSAFARRNPDNCDFTLKEFRKPRAKK